MKKLVLALFCAGITVVHASINLSDPRCESLRDPLGIDELKPRLSWIVSSQERGEKQTAYEILVASSAKQLGRDEGDLWSTGKVESDRSIQVRYAGKPLPANQECFWKVRAWNADGKASQWSKPSKWTMGLLKASDWKAQWIGKEEEEHKTSIAGTSWIWYPESTGNPAENAPIAHRYFRRTFDMPADQHVSAAELLVTGDNRFAAFVNGVQIGIGSNFKAVSSFDIAARLHAGKNVIAISINNTGDAPNPGGALALLKVNFANYPALVIATDETWKAAKKSTNGWEKVEFNDTKWKAAKKLGPVGMAPWGEIGTPENRRLAARYLRKEFTTDHKIRRATAYISGLGLSELYLNGKKIGNEVLSPGMTEYDKRVLYVTHDVTSEIHRGGNCVGVILGNGRFFAPRLSVPTTTRTYGCPKLLFQLRIEYADGSVDEVVSDNTWKLTDGGPIRANNEYDGEEYDARLEMKNWSRFGFEPQDGKHDAAWEDARFVAGPGARVSAQMAEPIRVTQTLKPISVKELTPGVYIYDMGQNMVGWCRLKVSGPKGTSVSMRHAEQLKPDGTLYLDNLRSSKVTDTYTLNGKGAEVYEPRFTYHGFRYVELIGFPGKPSLSSLEGLEVHDDLENAGDFTCSNPLLNQIVKNVRWGLRDNYRSSPTDCPQRDERQGWLGDRAFECKGETYMFNTDNLYAKWLRDMADGQKDNGSISDVCPSYWPLYNDNITWPSASIVMPQMLHEQFGDEGIIASHYASMKKWMDHMSSFIATNNIISKDSYGDWCVPPEEQSLIHSKDPKRQTSKPLLATAYFYNNCRLMSRYAKILGKTEDVAHYQTLAAKLKNAFNREFYKADLGQYDNGTQTSCVLPLAFGLVAEDQRERVFNHLVKTFEGTGGHIATGLVGGQWLNRVLSDNGRADISYAMATKTDYPSWGYMIKKGATTIWELWNGDTADPAMNSGNHLMLVGDLVIWFHEDLAGIKADPEQTGFKHIIMKPQPVGDLTFVKATHRSPYGLISSDWKKENGKFKWNITVPANSSATIYLPATSADSILESGQSATKAKGVTFLRIENGLALFDVQSGSYSFEK
ncbi:MAG: alpha-L-rhamnosidase [Verrucomicrobiales bacterium]|nr:alpha-L-rhamnosidase [Verrucomicrobiales bacterium]